MDEALIKSGTRPLVTFAPLSSKQENYSYHVVECTLNQAGVESVSQDEGSSIQHLLKPKRTVADSKPHRNILNQSRPHLAMVADVDRIYILASSNCKVVESVCEASERQGEHSHHSLQLSMPNTQRHLVGSALSSERNRKS